LAKFVILSAAKDLTVCPMRIASDVLIAPKDV